MLCHLGWRVCVCVRVRVHVRVCVKYNTDLGNGSRHI